MIPRLLVHCAAALLLLAACRKTPPDPSVAARGFLQAIASGRPSEAYRDAAFGFRSQQTETAFLATTQEMGLVGARVEALEPPTADGERMVKIPARLVSSRGDNVSLIVTMLSENGAWRVFSLRSPRSAATGRSENRFSPVGKTLAFNDAGSRRPPDEATLKSMVQETMAGFAAAVAARNFGEFYQTISPNWQAQVTERQLTRAFEGFMAQDVRLTGVAELDPVYDQPPVVSAEGLLIVSGRYPTRPYEVLFVFKYVYEVPEWKLFGLDVNLRPADGVEAAAK